MLPFAISIALTLFMYHQSLNAGFMLDDPLDLPRASDRTFIEILTSAGESSYYRPIPLIIWKVLAIILGRHDPVVLHAVLIATHALNGWLVALITCRLLDRCSGFVALLFFSWYPLSYQVVSIVNAFFHALATTGVLLATLLYWDARSTDDRSRSHVRLVLSLGAMLVGVFTHENGIMTPILIIAVEVLLLMRRQTRRFSLAPIFFALVAGGFFTVWQVVPRWHHSWHLDPPSLRLDGLYFLQGLAYPVTQELGKVPGLRDNDFYLVLFAGILTLLVLTLAIATRRRLIVGAFGIIWFLSAVLPAWVILPWNYVIDGPRLLYLASVGIAVIWSAALAPTVRSRPLGMLVSLGLIAAILTQSGFFIAAREALQAQGADLVAQLVSTATQSGSMAGRVYVNVPAWLSFGPTDYLLGHTGITMIPEYIGLGRSVYVHRGIQPAITSLTVPALARPWSSFYGPHGPVVSQVALAKAVRAGGGVYVTEFAPDRLRLRYAGHVEPGTAPDHTYVARFDNRVTLEQASIHMSSDGIAVDLIWYVDGHPANNVTVFVHLVGSTLTPLAQADGDPIGGTLPIELWQPGDRVHDHRVIEWQDPESSWQILVGLYDRVTGRRIRAVDHNGQHFENDAVPISHVA